MADRAYTVVEIDALRKACDNKWMYGHYSMQAILSGRDQLMAFSRSYMPSERAIGVEQLVRTAMLAGHTADDLYASDMPASVGTHPEGQDSEAGLVRSMGDAVGEAETPNPSPITPNGA